MATKESVFISCGGEDTRYSFVSHLCMAFCRRNISINLSEIEEANASVVVFSHDYAFSEPSLDDLVKVWRLRLENGHLVVPVLYGVAQSDVEQLNGSFGEAFSEHEGSDSAHRVPEWRKAVVEIARLPGHECNAQISESKFVEDIVTDVHEKLFPTDKLGIQSILLEIEDLICQQPWAIRCVGIWGMGGIGKTTVAQAAFARMSEHYEASCFIPDFDESFRTMGLHRLRGETLPAVFDINNRSHPRRRKRCLLVLDDVSNPLDAESFLGGFDRFGLGSLIIITSRDKQVLVYCGVKQIYEVRGLNEDESLHLFSRRAFGKDAMKKEFLNVSEMVVEYAMGNPKVLTYYGEKLKGKKPAEMKMAFLKLKQHTPHKIMELFKNNYDSLSDNERNIFLDIACFFAGETVDYVVQLFEACGFFPRVGIEVLVYKSLVFISDNRVVMHDLIRDVARQIVNGETTQIERRCRLWEASIIKYLLEEVDLQVNGTLDIQGISLDTSELSFDVKSMAFKKMYGLRVLKIYNSSPGKHPRVRLPNGLESLPNELRLLHWENYPLKSLPQKFNPENLVELNMSHSKIKKLWEGTKDLRNLKMIRLSHSRQLTEFPRLSKALNLEHIDVEGCTGLVKVSSSIQYLGKLVVLNLKGCSRLQTLPAMVNLKSLEVLNLSGCSELENIQDFSENIREIYLSGTAIREVPSSIENLSKLAILDLENCKRLQHLPMGVSYLKSLGTLKLSGCSNLVGLQNLDALYLRCLQHLDATKTTTMEESSHLFSHHSAIKESKLDGSQFFQNSFALQFRSDTLDAHGCTSLESITWCFERIPRQCLLSNCFALSPAVVKDLAAKALAGFEHMELFGAPPELEVCLPTSVGEIPTMHISTDPRITMQLASQREQPVGFVLSVVVAFSDNNSRDLSFGVKCIGSWRARKGFCHSSERIFWFWEPWEDAPKLRHDHTFVFCQQVMKPRAVIMYDEVEFEFYPVKEWGMRPHDSCTVKQCGAYDVNALIDKQSPFPWKEWSVASKEGKLVKQMASEPKHPQESPPMNPETPHK
ncbi:PREDICTED: probable WRKY transcription factor 16 [Tarenaya hassleriana]|uniref:probable WRKY transcription factor 16 n=1 Tax=Tarenaya hassleriana TaxID=28532 RepID=UPI0008FD3BCA|nr:PREDICTED: probable WRKY transcription factor 16 [Tarenaya hassleriana]